jgi:hypothetical protein
VVGQRPVGGPAYRESANRYSRERRIGEIPKGNPDAESEPFIRWDTCHAIVRIRDSRHQASGLAGLETPERSRAVHLEGHVAKDRAPSALCPSGNRRSR